MKNFFISLFTANENVLNDNSYPAGFLTISAVIFWLFLFIPVRLIPGNDYLFYLSLVKSQDIILPVLLSLITALSLTFHLYWQMRRAYSKSITLTLGTVLEDTAGLIFAATGPAVRVAALLSFFKPGNGIFLIRSPTAYYLNLDRADAYLITLLCTKVLGNCDVCKVDYKRRKRI